MTRNSSIPLPPSDCLHHFLDADACVFQDTDQSQPKRRFLLALVVDQTPVSLSQAEMRYARRIDHDLDKALVCLGPHHAIAPYLMVMTASS